LGHPDSGAKLNGHAGPVQTNLDLDRVNESAVATGLSLGSTNAAIRSGQIPSIRIGRRVFVPRLALEKFLNGEGIK
jgi:excisionase family DNA binding protein